MELINENKDLFNVDISPAICSPFYDIAEELGIEDEEEVDKICDFFYMSELSIDDIVEKFCKKYNI